MPIAVQAAKLKTSTDQIAQQVKCLIRTFQPETVFKWHGEMVHPSGSGFTQQGRQMVWRLEDSMRFLIHHNDSKFTRVFDKISSYERMKAIQTPYRAQNAYADTKASI